MRILTIQTIRIQNAFVFIIISSLIGQKQHIRIEWTLFLSIIFVHVNHMLLRWMEAFCFTFPPPPVPSIESAVNVTEIEYLLIQSFQARVTILSETTKFPVGCYKTSRCRDCFFAWKLDIFFQPSWVEKRFDRLAFLHSPPALIQAFVGQAYHCLQTMQKWKRHVRHALLHTSWTDLAASIL